jgi:hypothetical protein
LFPSRFVLHDRGQVFQFLDGNGRGWFGLLGLCQEWPRQNENDKKAKKAESSGTQFRPQQGSQPQTPLSGVIFHSQS